MEFKYKENSLLAFYGSIERMNHYMESYATEIYEIQNDLRRSSHYEGIRRTVINISDRSYECAETMDVMKKVIGDIISYYEADEKEIIRVYENIVIQKGE